MKVSLKCDASFHNIAYRAKHRANVFHCQISLTIVELYPLENKGDLLSNKQACEQLVVRKQIEHDGTTHVQHQTAA